MSKHPMGNFGKFKVNLIELEERAREIRTKHPELWSVRKLSKELHASNHAVSYVYHRIIKGVD